MAVAKSWSSLLTSLRLVARSKRAEEEQGGLGYLHDGFDMGSD